MITEKEIKYRDVEIDTVDVKIPNVSYNGFSGICEDSLYFFDSVQSFYYLISKDGVVGNRQIGMGNGPGELPVRSAVGVSYSGKTQSAAILGGSHDYYIYNRDKAISKKMMQTDNSKRSYESPTIYTYWDEVITRSDGNSIYYNVMGNDDDVSFVTQSNYFKEASVLMKVNINNGKRVPIGHYSPFYYEHRDDIRHLPHIYFDVDNKGGYYVTFQVDSLIYHYDKNENLIECFGRAGLNMDTRYSKSGTSLKSVMEAYENDIERVGFYYWLTKVDNYVFRSYRKSGLLKDDGLQIFENGVLVGDVEIPRGLKVAGYIAPYFISEIICDEETQRMYFYKFILK